MVYLAIILITFSIFIIYKEQGDTRYFLFLLTAGWIISVLFFIVYVQFLDQQELYQNLFFKKVLIIKLLPKFTIEPLGNAETIITTMNIGIVTFIYSALCFPLSFILPLQNNKKIYTLLAVPQLLQAIIYSPGAFIIAYKVLFSNSSYNIIGFPAFYSIEENIDLVTNIVNRLYIASGFSILIYNYFRAPKIKYFRSYYFLITSGYTSIILLFITFLWWAPKRLISLTTANDSLHFLPVSVLVEGNIIGYYPHIMLISFITLLLALYRFNHLYFTSQSVRTNIYRSFDITNSGIRFYNHMVKNFAMAVLVDAESLKTKAAENSATTPHADRIIKNANELLETVNGIQSKFSVNSLNLSVTNIKEVIGRSLDLIRLEDITLRYLADEHPLPVLLDAQHMKEVFVNILNNSIQALQQDPRTITIEVQKNKAWVNISISDTGCGIEKENLDKIFIPFFSTANRQENWGLGLSYCYRVIMAHQGRIYVDSESGKGTTVKILLPLSDR